VNAITGVPGDHVVLGSYKDVPAAQTAIWKQDWFLLRVPSAGSFRQIWEARDGEYSNE